MKKLNFLFLMLCAFMATTAQAQNPYIDKDYGVSVTENVIYGANATILNFLAGETNSLYRPLFMDVYEPVGDNGTNRPVMLVLHTGNFLPFPLNNGTGGTNRDSTVVEACKRFAARGYVACAVDYRKGWSPTNMVEDIRKYFLINAAYRGTQDGRTAVRFLRLSAQDGGNPYGINADKIGVFGIGTGGYISAAMNTIDAYEEIDIEKFEINLGAGPDAMVQEAINGDINGTSWGIVPGPHPFYEEGDTLCYPNHVTYADGTTISSKIDFAVNLGGALGDISWLDENSAPWVSFHVPEDPFAPYMQDIVTVPGTGDPDDDSDDFTVVEVDGSYNIQQKMNNLGINDIFNNISIEDYSDVADSRNDGYEGLFPVPNNVSVSSPWDFYAADNPNADDPFLDPVVAKTYWDSIFVYTAPRACIALGLDCGDITSTEILELAQFGVTAAPNPATSEIVISSDNDKPMLAIEVYDISGRMVQDLTSVNNSQYTLQRNNLTKGMYFVKLHFEAGIATQRVIFE